MASRKTALIIGSTKGLGLALTKQLAPTHTVYATARSTPESDTFPSSVHPITAIDVSKASSGMDLVKGLQSANVTSVDLVIITAGLFKTETLEKPNFDDEVAMYTIVAVAPVMIVSALSNANFLKSGAKIILVSSESGSITLRQPSEGGGNFGHHAGKAALNMVGKLLSLDLKDKGVTVGIVHPGFMRTDMTKNVGFDEFYDKGGGKSRDLMIKPRPIADKLKP